MLSSKEERGHLFRGKMEYTSTATPEKKFEQGLSPKGRAVFMRVVKTKHALEWTPNLRDLAEDQDHELFETDRKILGETWSPEYSVEVEEFGDCATALVEGEDGLELILGSREDLEAVLLEAGVDADEAPVMAEAVDAPQVEAWTSTLRGLVVDQSLVSRLVEETGASNFQEAVDTAVGWKPAIPWSPDEDFERIALRLGQDPNELLAGIVRAWMQGIGHVASMDDERLSQAVDRSLWDWGRAGVFVALDELMAATETDNLGDAVLSALQWRDEHNKLTRQLGLSYGKSNSCANKVKNYPSTPLTKGLHHYRSKVPNKNPLESTEGPPEPISRPISDCNSNGKRNQNRALESPPESLGRVAPTRPEVSQNLRIWFPKTKWPRPEDLWPSPRPDLPEFRQITDFEPEPGTSAKLEPVAVRVRQTLLEVRSRELETPDSCIDTVHIPDVEWMHEKLTEAIAALDSVLPEDDGNTSEFIDPAFRALLKEACRIHDALMAEAGAIRGEEVEPVAIEEPRNAQ